MEKYLDAAQPVSVRVEDLLSRMNIDEKVAEIGSIWAFEVLDNGRFSPENATRLLKNGMGQVSRGGVGTALSPADIATFCNDIQHFLKEDTRLGIPTIIHEECLNGFIARGATIFPQIIGLACTWDPDLVYRMTATIRQQMLAVGIRQGLSPVLDVVRDPRWGRVEETYGEDPFLVAAMGAAYIRGLQGKDINKGIIATIKHFAGYGKSEGGLNWAPADIPARLLREVYLYPFEQAVKKAGALSIMNAYNEIDGIPCGASMELLTKILREEWGFDGTVVSDYFAIEMLNTYHRVASDKGQAAMQALSAGIDIELPRYECFGEPLKLLIEQGAISIDLVDRAVARSLRNKFLLGLFENPYVQPLDVPRIFDTPDNRRLAGEIARKSIVLLKNENNLLPLSKDIKTIAVIGPNAANPRNVLGDYTYPAHIHLSAMSAMALNIDLPEHDFAADQIPVPVINILDGIRSKVSSRTTVIHAQGTDYKGSSRQYFEEAVRAAGAADLVIMVVGGKSGLTVENTCGEMRDSAELKLPGVQEDLIKTVHETRKPIVLVICDGRPLALGWIAKEIPAILEAWLPGEEGGNAVADVLFGDYNPGGKLAISFPVVAGQVPTYYGHKPSGARSQFWGDYVDCSVKPQYAFGHGLSYTTFYLRDLAIESAASDLHSPIKVSCTVENTGKRKGDEVIQLYITDLFASVTRPVLELKGFKRLTLEPGQQKQVEFEIQISELAFYGRDMQLKVEPGQFFVMIGHSSTDIALFGQFELTA
jgi:beta-glucosidase